jgi:hypothetical protein
MFLSGLFYLKIIEVSIENGTPNIVIESKIPQNAIFYMETEYKRSSLICNDTPIKIDITKKHDYFYRGEEQITLHLNRGENICKGKYINGFKRKISIVDLIILTILLGTPLLTLTFYLLIYLLNMVKGIKPPNIESITTPKWIFLIILLGVGVRVAYFNRYGVMLFQHDWQGHIDLIKYVASNHAMPNILNKGWEYPQQPLYYLITGTIYNLLEGLNFSHKEIIHHLGYFSLLCSAIFLYYGYKIFELLTQSRWVVTMGTLFLALTPSLVYMSARINNDVLVMGLGAMALYYTLKGYQNSFERYFYTALTTVTLLFLTKLSTAPMEILLFLLLSLSYIQTREKKFLFIFSVVGLVVLSWTLWRLYTPLTGSLYMVNSAEFPKQTIENLNGDYLLSLHLFELIQQGYSHVFGVDAIRYSLPTYQYGTMLFGEFNYKYFIDRDKLLLPIMQFILIFGTLYIVGLFSYILHIFKESRINQIIFGIFLLNLIVILKFIFEYPSVCNSDFRYFVGSFIIVGLIFSQGLEYISKYNPHLKCIFNVLLSLLFINELIFFYKLI